MRKRDECEVPTCEPDEIDEVLTNERLEILIRSWFTDACSPNLPNVELVGS